MYAWRKMCKAQREDVLRQRRLDGVPWHSPPHFDHDMPLCFHLTAACRDHIALIGHSPERMADFESELLSVLRAAAVDTRAWCVLPNHWHALVKTADLKATVRAVGRMHGRLSRIWNLEERMTGRSCWYCCADRRMRGEAHYFATLNYIHHNPIHHGYAEKWQEWPFSSAVQWLDAVGSEEAERTWRDFPLLDYGKGWDDP